MKPQPYPLHWPSEQPRTPASEVRDSRFRTSTNRAQRELRAELERMKATHVVLSTNIPTRQDGGFYASAREPDDSAVAVHFRWRGRPYAMGCDAYPTVKENVRALGKTIEAMRAIERHGATALLERAVSGFSALPPGQTSTAPASRPWWVVFELPEINGMTPSEVAANPDDPNRPMLLLMAETMHKRMIKTVHPDKGGSHEAALELNGALSEARAALTEDGDA